ncbi:MAG TPA: ABC transporter permease, partial [Corynebacterium sp.]|nr:ABC transporter permease [Corynebacterium sp.]
MAIFLGLSSQLFEQAHLTRSLHLMGVKRSFYFRTQLFETLGPIIIVSLIGFAFGAMVGTTMLAGVVSDVNILGRFIMAGAFLTVGWLFTAGAISAVEPLRNRTLTVGRNNG